MNKNTFFKALSLILCAVFICTVFSACSKPAETSSNVESSQVSSDNASTDNSSSSRDSSGNALSSQTSSAVSPTVSSNVSYDSNIKPVIFTVFAHYDGAYPKIEWRNVEGRAGWSAKVVIKDAAGKTVLTENGIKTNSYTVKKGIKVGQTYTVLVYYENPKGETGLVDGMPKNGIEVVYNKQNGKYYFDGGISLDVLNNYLNRAMTYCHVRGDDISLLKKSIVDAGVKYVQRADCAWIPEPWDYTLEDQIKGKLKTLHNMDPDIIFEACIFEYVDQRVNGIPIPAETFKAFGQPVQNRNFSYNKMVSPDWNYLNNWGEGASIPDITQLETQMFFYHRACFFIDMGFEALHLGQVKSIGHNDKNNECWTKVIKLIREYAKKNARRHYVILDAHHPDQKFQDKDGNMLTDFNAFPIRMKVAYGQISHMPSDAAPQKCIIQPGHKDSVYKLNISGVAPSGWYTNKYPYLVELDNYGVDVARLNKAYADIWGYDEITWFAIQPQWYRQEFMEYLTKQVDSYNENGHVAVAGKRWITTFPGCDEKLNTYYALGKAGDVNFFGDLEFYKDMWKRLGK